MAFQMWRWRAPSSKPLMFIPLEWLRCYGSRFQDLRRSLKTPPSERTMGAEVMADFSLLYWVFVPPPSYTLLPQRWSCRSLSCRRNTRTTSRSCWTTQISEWPKWKLNTVLGCRQPWVLERARVSDLGGDCRVHRFIFYCKNILKMWI